MSDSILAVAPMGFPWQTLDPFLFCVHHLDLYPEGNEEMGPVASLAGRNLGNDFEIKDGWRMYHGRTVPGFPQHPHRGFETITIARQGYIDHSDSLGAKARFGNGDVQWMTAGKGVVHSEMFPLVHRDKPNTTELFQIWLNLPREDKMVDPYFTMFWAYSVPEKTYEDASGRTTFVRFVAGPPEGFDAPAPPPNSWASREHADVSVWTIKMDANARWTLPAGGAESNRVLYFFSGSTLMVDGEKVESGHAIQVEAGMELELENGDEFGEILMLHGRPIGEPVAQHGPFVMNHPGEIRQAMIDYQMTGFGGWPWESNFPVHPRDAKRFAVHADGREEFADS